MKYYTGIGSRTTPDDVLNLMSRTASHLCDKGYTLRSGHAPGADQAFERACGGEAEIYLPWENFESDVPINGYAFYPPTPAAFEMAALYHPAWQYLKRGAKMLHARNCHQVLGSDLRTPSKFVVCWTPNGELKGGTAQALRIAKDHGIEVYNMWYDTPFNDVA